MRLRAFVALGLASFGLAFLVPASAQAAPVAPRAYPVTVCSTLSVSTQNPAPGQAITVAGANFQVNASVSLVLKPINGAGKVIAGRTFNLGTFKANASGSFSVQVTLPNDVTNKGHYNIYAMTGAVVASGCPADPFQELDFLGVTAASSSPAGSDDNGGGTANTGLDIAALVALAAVLLGGGLLLNRRGRRSSTRV